MMIAFFYGLPLAIVVTAVAMIAFVRTKKKVLWIPLGLGILPIVGWPIVFGLEALHIIP